MTKQRLAKVCPKCQESHLMAEPWGEHGESVDFRITCENLSCRYEPNLIQELKEYLNEGQFVRVENLPEMR